MDPDKYTARNVGSRNRSDSRRSGRNGQWLQHDWQQHGWRQHRDSGILDELSWIKKVQPGEEPTYRMRRRIRGFLQKIPEGEEESDMPEKDEVYPVEQILKEEKEHGDGYGNFMSEEDIKNGIDNDLKLAWTDNGKAVKWSNQQRDEKEAAMHWKTNHSYGTDWWMNGPKKRKGRLQGKTGSLAD